VQTCRFASDGAGPGGEEVCGRCSNHYLPGGCSCDCDGCIVTDSPLQRLEHDRLVTEHLFGEPVDGDSMPVDRVPPTANGNTRTPGTSGEGHDPLEHDAMVPAQADAGTKARAHWPGVGLVCECLVCEQEGTQCGYPGTVVAEDGRRYCANCGPTITEMMDGSLHGRCNCACPPVLGVKGGEREKAHAGDRGVEDVGLTGVERG
jgi:hypothetical protein